MLDYEHRAKRDGYSLVVGVDEAGRGPLAGPVVAAAVSLFNTDFQNRIDDSKKITARQRESAFHEIMNNAHVGVGVISESVIDDQNILRATYHAMDVAVEELINRRSKGDHVNPVVPNDVILLIDGQSFKTDLPYKFKPIIKGDNLSLSIACASIVAKVIRDRILNAYDQVFPVYGFKQHKGYPTRQHKQAIKDHGLSIIHRRTFNH